MKKFSIIFSFILLFFIAFTTISNAATYPDPTKLDLKYDYMQYFIYDSTLVILNSNDSNNYGSFPYIRIDTEGNEAGMFRIKPGGNVAIYVYKLVDNEWVNGNLIYDNLYNLYNPYVENYTYLIVLILTNNRL